MTRCTKQVLSKEWMTCQSILPCFARRRSMSYNGVHQHIFEKSSMFNSFLSLQNLFSSNGLVNISASWSSLSILSVQMSPFCWWSLMKWWRTSVGSHYRPIINCQLDPKAEEAIILYTHMHFITNKFHLYHSDYIL